MFMAILVAGVATAQNANRHGFFLELGVGGIVGSTPRNYISFNQNDIQFKCLSGAAGSFGIGGRIRIGQHWAYEIKADAMIPMNDPIYALVGRGMPIGFRYTSVELWQNYSLYAHFNLGGAIVVNNGYYSSNDVSWIPDPTEIKLRYNSRESYGVAYSVGVGVNLTTHLYVEGCFNAQAMFGIQRKNGYGVSNYGMVACAVGYRFL